MRWRVTPLAIYQRWKDARAKQRFWQANPPDPVAMQIAADAALIDRLHAAAMAGSVAAYGRLHAMADEHPAITARRAAANHALAELRERTHDRPSR